MAFAAFGYILFKSILVCIFGHRKSQTAKLKAKYCIDSNKRPALYCRKRVLNWWCIWIFSNLWHYIIKFLLKTWTFGNQKSGALFIIKTAQSSAGLQIHFSFLVLNEPLALPKTKFPPPTLFWSPWVPQIDVWSCQFWGKFICCFKKIPFLYYKML